MTRRVSSPDAPGEVSSSSGSSDSFHSDDRGPGLTRCHLTKMSVGDRLRKQRIAAGMTQEQLGARLGVSSRTVSRWEKNEVDLDRADAIQWLEQQRMTA